MLPGSSGTSVTASENTGTSQRSGTFTFVQYENGRTLRISLSQEASVVTYELCFDASHPDDFISGSVGGAVSEVICFKEQYINGEWIQDIPVSWSIQGLSSDIKAYIDAYKNGPFPFGQSPVLHYQPN